MAAIRPEAIIDFTPDIDKLTINTNDNSSLIWELLTHGFTRRFVKNAVKASYYHVKRHTWSDEGHPTVDALREYLKAHSLSSAAYSCRVRIGTPVEETPRPKDVLALLEARKREPDAETFLRVYHPFVEKLVVKVPTLSETETDVKSSRAEARSNPRPDEYTNPEEVHVKWGTDIDRMKKLYHEAQIYERLRNKPFRITPKFYGFYQKFSGEDPFAVSVFERTDVFEIEKEDEPTVMFYFMRAAQLLHLEGIYHGSLLKGSKEEGFTITNNVRVSLAPEDKNSRNRKKNNEGGSGSGDLKGKGKAIDSTSGGIGSLSSKGSVKKSKRTIQRVLFVNFEDSYRHPGHHCPSTNENLKMIRGGGCPELDNIYEFFSPWQPSIEDVMNDRKSSIISSI